MNCLGLRPHVAGAALAHSLQPPATFGPQKRSSLRRTPRRSAASDLPDGAIAALTATATALLASAAAVFRRASLKRRERRADAAANLLSEMLRPFQSPRPSMQVHALPGTSVGAEIRGIDLGLPVPPDDQVAPVKQQGRVLYIYLFIF
ncbi:unnamed protein product [Polarella glacialis]|uniref:Uncharacterized protein n=1 Tax=Polarella glacialis TaxID=89957 RepID=A0A813KKR4_POLGL|nr:unnamed protein product [Polarella glacialis]